MIPRCPTCGERWHVWVHLAAPARSMAAWPVGLAVLVLSGLLLAAQGSPRWQEQPSGFEVTTATLAARTIAVPAPEVAR